MKDLKEQSSYRSIFKATSVFGGVQFYRIVINIIKSKFIAILIGPNGVGINSLYTTAISMISQITSLGLSSSAVRNVAEAHGSGHQGKIDRITSVLKKLVWLTGSLGVVGVILLSPILSKASFGNYSYIIPFICLSIVLLFDQLSAGQNVILQGTRKIKYLSKASALGVTIGLFVSVPIYYWLRLDGIVPNIIIASFTTLLISWYYARKVKINKVPLSVKETFLEGKSMLVLGIAMSATHLLESVSSYALRGLIRLWAGLDAVGIFSAGFALMTQYTGLIFTAMGTDYYPRLSAVNKDNKKCQEIMNQQGEIGLLLLAPLLIFCIIFVPFVIKILYSNQFLAANNYIIWVSSGMLFKMASWSISYLFIAKGESKLFFINEFVASLYTLALNLIGFRLDGFAGLGKTFAISYVLYFFQVFITAHKRYGFIFNRNFIRTFIIQTILLISCLLCVYLFSPMNKYIIGGGLGLLSAIYSIIYINKRIDLISGIRRKIVKR